MKILKNIMNFLVFWHKMAIFYHNGITHLCTDLFLHLNCITLFHTVGLISFIAIFWPKFRQSMVFGSWKAPFLAKKKCFGTNWPLWPTYTFQRKILRLGCPFPLCILILSKLCHIYVQFSHHYQAQVVEKVIN